MQRTGPLGPGRIETVTESLRKAGGDHLITIIAGDTRETVKQPREPNDES